MQILELFAVIHLISLHSASMHFALYLYVDTVVSLAIIFFFFNILVSYFINYSCHLYA